MLARHLVLSLAAAAASLCEKLDVANRDATTNLVKSLVAPVADGTLTAAWPWISASSFTTVMHYSHYTGDSQYNDRITTKILGSAGGSQDFLGISPGNDDQLWWGLACITAAEYGIADLAQPTADGKFDNWLKMAGHVFDSVTSRWQADTCSGIGWQVAKPDYRNSITNGLAFQLAARLGRYTGEKKYIDWADKIFDWTFSSGLIDKASYSVYDGISAPTCDASTMDRQKWTYNVGVFLYGAAVMRESTGHDKWQQHLDGLIGAAKTDFTKDDILVESTCENGSCNADQQTFKATLARWLALASRLVPSTADEIQPILDASAKAALSSCNDQSQCSLVWTARKFAGGPNLGAQMAAVEITGAQLAKDCKLPMKAGSAALADGTGSANDTALTNGTTSVPNKVLSSDAASTNGTTAIPPASSGASSSAVSDSSNIVSSSEPVPTGAVVVHTSDSLPATSTIAPTDINPSTVVASSTGDTSSVIIPTTTVSANATAPATHSGSSAMSVASTEKPGTPSATDNPLATGSTATAGAVLMMNKKRSVIVAFTA